MKNNIEQILCNAVNIRIRSFKSGIKHIQN